MPNLLRGKIGHIQKMQSLVVRNTIGTRVLAKNLHWHDAGGKLQNSQITLDMLPPVDKTYFQIEQAWLSDFSPDESGVKSA